MSDLFGSTKITFGLHCLNIRHKAMYMGEVPNPGEDKFYDSYDATGYCAPIRKQHSAPTVSRSDRMCARAGGTAVDTRKF